VDGAVGAEDRYRGCGRHAGRGYNQRGSAQEAHDRRAGIGGGKQAGRNQADCPGTEGEPGVCQVVGLSISGGGYKSVTHGIFSFLNARGSPYSDSSAGSGEGTNPTTPPGPMSINPPLPDPAGAGGFLFEGRDLWWLRPVVYVWITIESAIGSFCPNEMPSRYFSYMGLAVGRNWKRLDTRTRCSVFT